MKAFMAVGASLLVLALGFVTYQWMETRAVLEGLKQRLDSAPARIEVSIENDNEAGPFVPSSLRQAVPRDYLRGQRERERIERDFLDEVRRANDIEEDRLQMEQRDRFKRR